MVGRWKLSGDPRGERKNAIILIIIMHKVFFAFFLPCCKSWWKVGVVEKNLKKLFSSCKLEVFTFLCGKKVFAVVLLVQGD